MAKCKLGTSGCFNDGTCRFSGECENRIISNADRIRAMSDEELSVFLWEFEREDTCRDGEYFITRRKLDEWLKQSTE